MRRVPITPPERSTQRKSVATLLSAALLAVTLLAGDSLAGPASAQAAGCKWQMPTRATIVQGNNHRITLSYSAADGYYKARSYSAGKLRTASSEAAFPSFTPRLVRFIITWCDDTAGIYTGSVDSDGRDPRPVQPPRPKTSFYVTNRARCG